MGGSTGEVRLVLPIPRAVPSNHGRRPAPVKIKAGQAHPVIGKSGLITTLANTDGYIRIPRDKRVCKKMNMLK